MCHPVFEIQLPRKVTEELGKNFEGFSASVEFLFLVVHLLWGAFDWDLSYTQKLFRGGVLTAELVEPDFFPADKSNEGFRFKRPKS